MLPYDDAGDACCAIVRDIAAGALWPLVSGFCRFAAERWHPAAHCWREWSARENGATLSPVTHSQLQGRFWTPAPCRSPTGSSGRPTAAGCSTHCQTRRGAPARCALRLWVLGCGSHMQVLPALEFGLRGASNTTSHPQLARHTLAIHAHRCCGGGWAGPLATTCWCLMRRTPHTLCR